MINAGGSESKRGISRDEMNLAEFPLTVLSTRADPTLKTLEFKDSLVGKNGDLVDRQWIITGADKFGLPTASDDEVLLGLLKLTVEEGMKSRKVYFTRYELLKVLRWTTEGRSYSRLQKALDRLSGVRIKATNAFYDNDLKKHSTKNFGLIDEYEINSGRDETRPSFFVWSDVLFKSFQVGFIKKLDLNFYLELQSAVTKRLYRYLDKHFWYRSHIRINIFTLAHEKIGVSRNYRYASSLRQQLDPAFEELVTKGFLSSYNYEGKGSETEVLVSAGKALKTVASKEENQNSARDQKNDIAANTIRQLVERGLSERQVLRLVAGKSQEVLDRIHEIIQYYDSLLAKKSHLISKSPVGFLYRAVENAQTFILPKDKKQEELPLASREMREKVILRKEEAEKARQDTLTMQADYLVFRRRQIEEAKRKTDALHLRRLRNEVEIGLNNIRSRISPDRFRDSVEHAVEEKIAKSLALPSFDEWRERRGQPT
jgi:plasmid replication initiation protein